MKDPLVYGQSLFVIKRIRSCPDLRFSSDSSCAAPLLNGHDVEVEAAASNTNEPLASLLSASPEDQRRPNNRKRVHFYIVNRPESRHYRYTNTHRYLLMAFGAVVGGICGGVMGHHFNYAQALTHSYLPDDPGARLGAGITVGRLFGLAIMITVVVLVDFFIDRSSIGSWRSSITARYRRIYDHENDNESV